MLTLFLLISPCILIGQNHALSIFDNLVGKTWKAEGNWGDGSKFSQEIDIHYSLDKSIVIFESIGFIDKAQSQLGLRNHGIRQYDSASKKIKFWEFDVFGGLTEGVVLQEGKNIVYQYEYGGTKITDMWEYVDDFTYNFKVGDYANGKWNQIYLSTQFNAQEVSKIENIYNLMKQQLAGNWSSEAWNGRLDESWSTDKNDHIVQSAQYLEDEKVLYEASNKIEIVNGELILFTVIEDNNPKIFKATTYSKDRIIFENSDYENPNTVEYKFLSKDKFERTISGIENGEPTTYTFMFEKADQ